VESERAADAAEMGPGDLVRHADHPQRGRVEAQFFSLCADLSPRSWSRGHHSVYAIELDSGPAIIDAMDTVTERRSRMQVRVYPSLTAHDQDDARFWAALPVEERVLQVWKLSEAQWRLRGEFPDASGLPRSTARVHRR